MTSDDKIVSVITVLSMKDKDNDSFVDSDDELHIKEYKKMIKGKLQASLKNKLKDDIRKRQLL